MNSVLRLSVARFPFGACAAGQFLILSVLIERATNGFIFLCVIPVALKQRKNCVLCLRIYLCFYFESIHRWWPVTRGWSNGRRTCTTGTTLGSRRNGEMGMKRHWRSSSPRGDLGDGVILTSGLSSEGKVSVVKGRCLCWL
jgi:hypothetical protein